ncbi:MAG: TRAP transporter small permease [Bacillota bacterium]
MNIIHNIWSSLLYIQKGIMIVTSSLIVIGLGITVVLRYIFQTGLHGLEELIIIPAFWMYFMGAAYGTYKKEHITADILSVYLKSEKKRLWLNLIISLINFSLISIFAYWSIEYIIWSINSGAHSNVWKYPMYIPQSSILVGFGLMTLYTFIDLVKNILKLRHYKT